MVQSGCAHILSLSLPHTHTHTHTHIALSLPHNTHTHTCNIALMVQCLHGSDRLWAGYHESRRCSRDTYPESYITKHTSIRREMRGGHVGIYLLLLFFTLVTGPRSSLSLKLSDTRVYNTSWYRSAINEPYSPQMCSGSEAGSTLCITQLYA